MNRSTFLKSLAAIGLLPILPKFLKSNGSTDIKKLIDIFPVEMESSAVIKSISKTYCARTGFGIGIGRNSLKHEDLMTYNINSNSIDDILYLQMINMLHVCAAVELQENYSNNEIRSKYISDKLKRYNFI